MPSLTIVSGLINIGREEIGTSFARSFDHYKECFAKLLTTIKVPMYLYISPDLEDFVWQHRDRSNTTIKLVTKESLKTSFPFFKEVQNIRTDPEWFNQKGWLAESTQARLEYYNPLIMSKMFWLNDVAVTNPHNSKHFLWLDAGISNTVNHELLGDKFQHMIESYLDECMFFLCFPYEPDGEIHGFKATDMNAFANTAKVNRVARAGLFGGTKECIHKMNGAYYSYLAESLYSGLMGTEESIFTILTYRHPEVCKFEYIGENGLIAPWIEKMLITNKEDRHNSRLGIYSVCFNLPDQYQMWVDSFEKNQKGIFKNSSKYAINNSTDETTTTKFDTICDKNTIVQIKKPENIGICGARQLCAEMFDTSSHEYMVFFEDDMLLCGASTPPCKNGLIRYDAKLFEKCMSIMEKEQLDYLKLSFTEFFGDNHLNWAWHNLPLSKKIEFFPGPQVKGVCNRTKIAYTGAIEDLSYAVGDFHYCNWPVMFSKQGSRKIFLDTTWAHPFEQTWMSQAHQLISTGSIKAGCLLATTINHNRVHHYDGTMRKENAG